MQTNFGPIFGHLQIYTLMPLGSASHAASHQHLQTIAEDDGRQADKATETRESRKEVAVFY
jgi:hypothetical protein